MVTRLIVRIVAFAMRRGVTAEDAMEALSKSHPHRDGAWRLDVIEQAEARNVIRANRRRMAGRS